MTDEKLYLLAAILHDVINEIVANDDKTNENLKILQNKIIENFLK